MSKLYLISIFIICGISNSFAQKSWSLKECIDYAIDNNIDIQKYMLEKESREINLNSAQMSRLPNVNAGVGENFGFGRSADRDGVTRDNSSSNTSFSISTGVPVFTGFRIPNEIALQKFELAAAIEDLSKAKEDLSLNITSYFLQTLLYKELLLIAQDQVALSQEQVVKTDILVKAGKSPLSELADINAQLAKDQLTLTENINNVKISLLTLSQMLNLEDEHGFDIEMPDFDSLSRIAKSIIEAPATLAESFLEKLSVSLRDVTYKPDDTSVIWIQLDKKDPKQGLSDWLLVKATGGKVWAAFMVCKDNNEGDFMNADLPRSEKFKEIAREYGISLNYSKNQYWWWIDEADFTNTFLSKYKDIENKNESGPVKMMEERVRNIIDCYNTIGK